MKKLNAEEFVKAWQGSASLSEVSEKLERKPSALQQRAAYFRKHGVPLKKFKIVRQDWNKLIALAKSLAHKA